MGPTIDAEPTRHAGLQQLTLFARRAGPHYSRSRNYDFGPGQRDNVSMLSAYVRHRLVLEQELVSAALSHHSLEATQKFVEEVFWRGYFKGWLEQHPDVWTEYQAGVTRALTDLPDDESLLARYRAAVRGKTGIECFDAWANELVRYGYLHNHARMWFASIWVFTLDLPWQLGADFFYRHLIDADPASNTLSWRWVCGLHTRGKTYLAREPNIAKYTGNRFTASGRLAAQAPALEEAREFPLCPLTEPSTFEPDQDFGLLITEEDGSPESLLEKAHEPAAILGAADTALRSPLPVGAAAQTFTRGAVEDAVNRAAAAFDVSAELAPAGDWGTLLADWANAHRLNTIATAHAPVGPVAQALARAGETLDRHGIRLVFLHRAYDRATWPHAQRGYFKLKQKIPEVLQQLGISASACGGAQQAG